MCHLYEVMVLINSIYIGNWKACTAPDSSTMDQTPKMVAKLHTRWYVLLVDDNIVEACQIMNNVANDVTR